MITVIFNKEMQDELSYQFDNYAENYSKNGGWILRFGVTEDTLDNINGNLGDELSDLLNADYSIATIHVYDKQNKLIDYFDDYFIISECITGYDELTQQQRGELRLEK